MGFVLVTMILQVVIGLVLVGASYQARSNGEIKAWFIQHAMECSKEYPVSSEEMMMMKSHKIPDSKNAKCLIACVFKKADYINEKGNFDVEKANAWAEKEFPDDPKRLAGAKKIYDLCKKVNEETVSDGEKGCERAYHLSKCLVENAPEMGFPIPK